MSGYLPDCYRNGNTVIVRRNGKKVKRKIVGHFFTSSPVHNSDYLQLKLDDKTVLSSDERDEWFRNDNSENPIPDKELKEKLDFQKWRLDNHWSYQITDMYWKLVYTREGCHIEMKTEEQLFKIYKDEQRKDKCKKDSRSVRR